MWAWLAARCCGVFGGGVVRGTCRLWWYLNSVKVASLMSTFVVARNRLAVRLTASGVGAALEAYEWSLYALLVTYFSRHFFGGSLQHTVVYSLGVFALGFVIRPVGALVLGRLADRRGRRPALVVSIVIAGVATLAMTLTPGRETVGAAAPVLLLVWRLLLGFSFGGEQAIAQAYMYESAPPRRRILGTSVYSIFYGLGTVCANLIVAVLVAGAGKEAVAAGYWRVPFGVAAVLSLVFMVVRSGLPETLGEAVAAEEGGAGLRAAGSDARGSRGTGVSAAGDGVASEAAGAHVSGPEAAGSRGARLLAAGAGVGPGVSGVRGGVGLGWATEWQRRRTVLWPMLAVAGLTAGSLSSYYLWIAAPTSFAISVLKMPDSQVLWAGVVSQLAFMLIVPVWGWLAERVGVLRWMAGASLILAVATIPMQRVMNSATVTTYWVLMIGAAVCVATLSATLTGASAAVAPARYRVTVMALPYAIANAVFGGTTPALKELSGSHATVFSVYMAVLLVVTAATALLARSLDRSRIAA